MVIQPHKRVEGMGSELEQDLTILQGLDVVCFRAFKTYWAEETLNFKWRTGKVTKSNFVNPLTVAWKKKVILSKVKSTFSKTGLYPFNHDAITSEHMDPSKETLMKAPLPLPTIPSPV